MEQNFKDRMDYKDGIGKNKILNNNKELFKYINYWNFFNKIIN